MQILYELWSKWRHHHTLLLDFSPGPARCLCMVVVVWGSSKVPAPLVWASGRQHPSEQCCHASEQNNETNTTRASSCRIHLSCSFHTFSFISDFYLFPYFQDIIHLHLLFIAIFNKDENVCCVLICAFLNSRSCADS